MSVQLCVALRDNPGGSSVSLYQANLRDLCHLDGECGDDWFWLVSDEPQPLPQISESDIGWRLEPTALSLAAALEVAACVEDLSPGAARKRSEQLLRTADKLRNAPSTLTSSASSRALELISEADRSR